MSQLVNADDTSVIEIKTATDTSLKAKRNYIFARLCIISFNNKKHIHDLRGFHDSLDLNVDWTLEMNSTVWISVQFV